MNDIYCEECQLRIWKAGELAPAGVYIRVDDKSYRTIVLEHEDRLPATFDAHVALYCVSTCKCREHALNRATTYENHKTALPS